MFVLRREKTPRLKDWKHERFSRVKGKIQIMGFWELRNWDLLILNLFLSVKARKTGMPTLKETRNLHVMVLIQDEATPMFSSPTPGQVFRNHLCLLEFHSSPDDPRRNSHNRHHPVLSIDCDDLPGDIANLLR